MNAGIMPVISRQTVWLRGFAQKNSAVLRRIFLFSPRLKPRFWALCLFRRLGKRQEARVYPAWRVFQLSKLCG